MADAIPLLINDCFAVLFGKRSLLRVRQYAQNHFGGAAELRSQRRHHHRTINEDRMSQHRIEQFFIAEPVFSRAELLVGSVFLRSRARTLMSMSVISFFSSSRDGGVSRYRITVARCRCCG